jgi:hypothetical protein
MKDLAARERLDRQMRAGLEAMGKMTALLLVLLGVLLLVSGAIGNDLLSRMFTRGALRLNDAASGTVTLAVALVLLRVAGRAPLWDQVRAVRYWDRRRWISVGLFATGALANVALTAIEPLLPSSPWMHYGFTAATTLVIIIALLLWPNGQDRAAPS